MKRKACLFGVSLVFVSCDAKPEQSQRGQEAVESVKAEEPKAFAPLDHKIWTEDKLRSLVKNGATQASIEIEIGRPYKMGKFMGKTTAQYYLDTHMMFAPVNEYSGLTAFTIYYDKDIVCGFGPEFQGAP